MTDAGRFESSIGAAKPRNSSINRGQQLSPVIIIRYKFSNRPRDSWPDTYRRSRIGRSPQFARDETIRCRARWYVWWHRRRRRRRLAVDEKCAVLTERRR